MLGYNQLKTTFEELRNTGDTIFLKKELIILEDIVIKDCKGLISSIYNNIQDNYSHFPHSDIFFLRAILKRNDSIIKVEDVSGKIKRNSIFASNLEPELNFEFQLLNQRKLGLLNKNKRIEDHKLQTLNDLFTWFSTVFINPNYFELFEENTPDSSYTKVSYNPLEGFENKAIGHYIINNKDKSIKEYYSKTNPLFKDEIEFTKKRGFKWRTINSELTVNYDKSKKNKYFLSRGLLKQTLEAFNRENEKIIYEVEYNLIVTEPFSDINSFRSNVKSNKELFELDIDFDKEFWSKQNQLPLTNELNEFIKNVYKLEKEYLIISNF